MLLERSTIGVCHALLRFPDKRSLLAVLRFLAQTSPLVPCGLGSSQNMSQRLTMWLYTFPMSSDFVTRRRLENLHFAKYALPLVYGQEITTILFNGFI
jgi:hypothetical protein